ncbi:unnamed protein product, partial [Staurois parvus]
WGPRAIGNHGAPVSLPKLKKAYEKVGEGPHYTHTHTNQLDQKPKKSRRGNGSTQRRLIHRGRLTTHGALGQ